MFFQRFLKGINAIGRDEALTILTKTGILSNWWRTVRTITPEGVDQKLTDRNLDWHLNRYEEYDATVGAPFRDHTPFISTTAGTMEPDPRRRANIRRDAFYTAAWFATDGFRSDGYIFFGYVYTLGQPAVPLEEFAEEVRELHVYTTYLPYRLEGEIVAKVSIGPRRIARADFYSGPKLRADLAAAREPAPDETLHNPSFQPPEQYANVRDVL